jgi:hypothetical protein
VGLGDRVNMLFAGTVATYGTAAPWSSAPE